MDLAGCEKVKKSNVNQGKLMKEAQSINQGLSTLGRVIEALVKKRRSIPFRDSMLTQILKDSLIGNTKTTVVLNCSPHIFNRDETISTCKFGMRCKLLKTRIVANKELTPNQMKSLIRRLKNENMRLKENTGNNNNNNNIGIGIGSGSGSSSALKNEDINELWQYKVQIKAKQELIDKLEMEAENHIKTKNL